MRKLMFIINPAAGNGSDENIAGNPFISVLKNSEIEYKNGHISI